MIRAKHGKTAGFLFDLYIIRQLRKSFSNFYMINGLPEIPTDAKLVITPNHISWWDGFFIDFVMKKLSDRKLYLMMLEKELRKYKFFSRVGAFSINPGSAASLRETAGYVNEILDERESFTVIYPQGEIEQWEKRPLNLKEGTKFFLKGHPEALVLPAGFKIEYYNKKRPAVICRFGKIIPARKVIEDSDYFRREFYANLDELGRCAADKSFDRDLFL